MPELKIRMFGVCLATPLSDDDKPKTVPKLMVLTPSSPRSKLASDGETQIDALFTYFVVRSANVSPDSKRKADHLMRNETVSAFVLHREEITLSVDDKSGVRLPYGEEGFPENPTIASKDPRWICNLPSLLPGAKIREDCLERASPKLPNVLEARLTVWSGEFSGTFPCGPKGKTQMHRVDLERHFAQEMAFTIDLPDGVVSLLSTPFDSGQQSNAIDLVSLGGNDIEVFFVNAPLITMMDVAEDDPCSISHNEHHNAPIDYEFEVLWDLIDMPRGTAKPVPKLILQQGTRVDCVPGGG